MNATRVPTVIKFCEAQIEIYDNGDGVYHCMPGGIGWSVESGGDGVSLLKGPEGQEVLMLETKVSLCQDICTCNATSCYVDLDAHPGIELDIAVDIEHGLMLGTGGVGRIEALKQ